MVDGETTAKEIMTPIPATVIPPSSVIPVPANPFPGCCNDTTLMVLADNTGLPLQNDLGGPDLLMWVDGIATGGSMALQKWVNGAWATQDNLTGSTCGTPYAFGFFVNNAGQKFMGFQMIWANVLATYGTGTYRVQFNFTVPILGNVTTYSNQYCLMTYSAQLADGTLRLEYWMSGVTGDPEVDTNVRDYGNLNWYASMRLRGYFGYPKTAYKRDYIQLNNGEQLYVDMEKTPTYQMEILLVLPFIHTFLENDFMMADTLAVTDYNSLNNTPWVQKYVVPTSGYEPKWYELQANKASVALTFTNQTNRFRKLRP